MNEVVKNVCDKLVKKVYSTQTTDTSNLVKKNWLWHKNWWKSREN